tara:strand:- start:45 stop:362 length:318 start_codon:yes stop_codon:yes gene_type:complete
MPGVIIYIPEGEDDEARTVILPHPPRNSKMGEEDLAALFSQDLMDSEGCIVHEINTEMLAFTLVQDGMYEYNKKATYAIQETQGIMVAFEGPVCLYLRPPETISR